MPRWCPFVLTSGLIICTLIWMASSTIVRSCFREADHQAHTKMRWAQATRFRKRRCSLLYSTTSNISMAKSSQKNCSSWQLMVARHLRFGFNCKVSRRGRKWTSNEGGDFAQRKTRRMLERELLQKAKSFQMILSTAIVLLQELCSWPNSRSSCDILSTKRCPRIRTGKVLR